MLTPVLNNILITEISQILVHKLVFFYYIPTYFNCCKQPYSNFFHTATKVHSFCGDLLHLESTKHNFDRYNREILNCFTNVDCLGLE